MDDRMVPCSRILVSVNFNEASEGAVIIARSGKDLFGEADCKGEGSAVEPRATRNYIVLMQRRWIAHVACGVKRNRIRASGRAYELTIFNNCAARRGTWPGCQDRKSTRLNSSHSQISYAV